MLSPSSGTIDRRDKFAQYEAAGVAHYWLVDPKKKSIEGFELIDGAYRPSAPHRATKRFTCRRSKNSPSRCASCGSRTSRENFALGAHLTPHSRLSIGKPSGRWFHARIARRPHRHCRNNAAARAAVFKTEHVVVNYAGITKAQAASLGRVAEAARAAAVQCFGFDVPEAITVNVDCKRGNTVQLFTDGQDT